VSHSKFYKPLAQCHIQNSTNHSHSVTFKIIQTTRTVSHSKFYKPLLQCHIQNSTNHSHSVTYKIVQTTRTVSHSIFYKPLARCHIQNSTNQSHSVTHSGGIYIHAGSSRIIWQTPYFLFSIVNLTREPLWVWVILHTVRSAMFRRILLIPNIFSNSINRLLCKIERHYVFCGVGAWILNIISISVRLQRNKP
jgi:hypothetical protein